MRCSKCNRYLEPKDVFCPQCHEVAPIPANVHAIKPRVMRDSLSCSECGEANISPLMNRCPKCQTYFLPTTWTCNGCNQVNLYPTTHCAHCGLTMGAKTKPSEYHKSIETAEKEVGKKKKRYKPYSQVTDDILLYYKYLINFGIFLYSIYCAISGALTIDSSPIAAFIFFICSVTAFASRFYLAERSALGPKIYMGTRMVCMYCTIFSYLAGVSPRIGILELLPTEVAGPIGLALYMGLLFVYLLANFIFQAEAKYFAKRENYFDQ